MGAIVRRLARRDRFVARRGRRSGEQAACLSGAPAPPVQPTYGSPSPGFFPGLSFGPCFRPSSSRSGSLLFSLSLCSAGCESFTPVGSLFIIHSCTRLGHATASKTRTRPNQIPAIPTQHHAAVTKNRVLLKREAPSNGTVLPKHSKVSQKPASQQSLELNQVALSATVVAALALRIIEIPFLLNFSTASCAVSWDPVPVPV